MKPISNVKGKLMFLVKYNDSKRILSLPIFIFTFGDYGTLDLVPRLGNHDTNYIDDYDDHDEDDEDDDDDCFR